MTQDLIAEYTLIGHQTGRDPFPVHARIWKPMQSNSMAPAWSCTVSVEPFYSKSFDIYGDDSFQALCLGAKHVVQMLATFAEQEGTLRHPDGEVVDLSVFGFSLLPRNDESAARDH